MRHVRFLILFFLNAEEFWLNNKMNCPCLLCKKRWTLYGCKLSTPNLCRCCLMRGLELFVHISYLNHMRSPPC